VPGSRRRKTALVRGALLGLFVVLSAAIVLRLAFRVRPARSVHPDARPLAQEKVQVQEGVRYKRYRGDRELEVKAVRRFTDAGGLYHLDGPVEIRNRGRKGGRELLIEAAHVLYDRDETRFDLQGGVALHVEGLTVRGPAFVYDRDKETIRTDAAVTFSGERYEGEGGSLFYRVPGEEMTMGGVTCRARVGSGDPERTVITADRLDYGLGRRSGEFVGNVVIARGKSRGRADEVRFVLAPERDAIRRADLLGRVSADVEDQGTAEEPAPGPPAGKVPESEIIFFQGARRHIEAGSAELLPYGAETWLHAILLRGGALVRVSSGPERTTTLEGEEIDLYYLQGGVLRDFAIRTSGRITGAAGEQTRSVEAATIYYDAGARILRLSGRGEEQPRTSSRGRSISADKISLYLHVNHLSAEGRVKLVSTPGQGGAPETSFFQSDRPVYAGAGMAAYDDQKDSFYLGAGVRLWQGRESLEARGITFGESSGDMAGGSDRKDPKDRVRSVLYHRPKDKTEDQRVEISAANVARDGKTGRVTYIGDCVLTAAAAVLKAAEIVVEPAEAAGKPRRIRARTRVVINQGIREAEGVQADFDLETETIVLTGRPVLREKDKAEVRGDKLTFRLSDGRIQVENRDPERSVTVIKS
jgi:lipopolysaccharide transport protein LptA